MELEEKAIREALIDGTDLDEVIPEAPDEGSFDFMTFLAGATDGLGVPESLNDALFRSS